MKICAQNGYGLEPHVMCGYSILFHFLLFSDVETGRPLTPSPAYAVSGKAAVKVSKPRPRYMTGVDVEGSRLLGYRCTGRADCVDMSYGHVRNRILNRQQRLRALQTQMLHILARWCFYWILNRRQRLKALQIQPCHGGVFLGL